MDRKGCSDDELMALIATEDDSDAFAVLYERHQGRLRALLAQRLYPDEIEDTAQLVMIAIWRGRQYYWKTLDPNRPRTFSAYLARRARWAVYDCLRKRSRVRVTLQRWQALELPPEMESLQDLLIRAQIYQRIEFAQAALLTEGERCAVSIWQRDEGPHDDRTRGFVHRALKKLRAWGITFEGEAS